MSKDVRKKRFVVRSYISQDSYEYGRPVEEMSDNNYKVACRYAVDLHKDFAKTVYDSVQGKTVFIYRYFPELGRKQGINLLVSTVKDRIIYAMNAFFGVTDYNEVVLSCTKNGEEKISTVDKFGTVSTMSFDDYLLIKPTLIPLYNNMISLCGKLASNIMELRWSRYGDDVGYGKINGYDMIQKGYIL